MLRTALRHRHTGLKISATGVAVVLVITITITLALVGGQDDSDSAASQAITCTPGSGLRSGAVPNGWNADVMAASAASGVPAPVLAAQLEAESGWNPKATSGAGAQGLAQFMPATWDAYGEGDPFDPKAAIAAQGTYMGVLLTSVTPIATSTSADPVVLALAAYNAGPARIEQYQGVPPFAETQKYVQKIPELAQQMYSGDCTAPGAPAAGVPPVGPGQWVIPLPGAVLTSPFGMRWGVLHAGIDLAMPNGQPAGTVTAPVDLFITYATCGSDGYGCSVVGAFKDGTGFQMRFGHMVTGSLKVTEGDTAKAGTALGTMGATGDVTGPHLHFEIYSPGSPTNAYAGNGTPIDPLPILTSKGVKLG
ncbi:murein DD-endopeptidase MepM/ murein hydrolase activator NlpD [Antricoccus suffuscus]|uniref:Murein DD-endopeptidase MepM/ murein hydrolase activator NlpD n=1 Tax=Antricoccus suffuscus TaxID=1629062 RepID=A0A2T0ZTJ5_9ACTN|nr:peptidoglycan DD-metalloendopeptidase family protein [Antricoccus suffuscus]PRZ39676.1 murein DD-endopeptidase MepM/ murein hydrolase activator NlpD [Antricoccus suffuscus]